MFKGKFIPPETIPLKVHLNTTLGIIPLVSSDGGTHGTVYESEEDFRVGGTIFFVEAIRLSKSMIHGRWQAVNPAYNFYIDAYYRKVNGDPNVVMLHGYPFYVHLFPHPAN